MAFVVLAQALAFQRHDPENPTVPVGEEEIVERGGEVPDYATTFTVSALANSGLVAYVDRPDPLVFPANQAPAQARTPDQPPVLPSDPNGVPPLIGDTPMVTTNEDEVTTDDEPDNPAAPAPLPANSDRKEVWESYAQRPEIGMTQAEAESMNKTALVAEVTARYDAAHQ